MPRILLLSLLALLALPAAAFAAPAVIAPRAAAVSAAGTTSVEVANPNLHALHGRAAVLVAGRSVASRAVRLPKRSVTTVRLRLGAGALGALRAAGGRATITLRLARRGGGRASTARRRLTLRLPTVPPPAPGPDAPPAPGPDAPPAPSPDAPAGTDRWVGRMGGEGPFDDLELTATGGGFELTKPPFVPVSCYQSSTPPRVALSLELFSARGPWTPGTETTVAQQAPAVNTLVSGGARTINHTVAGLTVEPGRITGTLRLSFMDSRYDFMTKRVVITTCGGTQSFEAVPAG